MEIYLSSCAAGLKMHEKTFLKISYLTIIFGLVFLLFYSTQFNYDPQPELDSITSPEQVLMRGTIKQLKTTDKAIFFRLEGQKVISTDVILFPDSSIYLHDNDYVEIIGQVEEYKRKKEIIAEKIILK